MRTEEIAPERLEEAQGFVERLEAEIGSYIHAVADGPFVQAVTDGSFPIDGIRFVHTNHYHLIINDMANLNYYVARARNEEEMLFFHFMAAEEKNHLLTLFLLTDALGIGRDELRASEPHAPCLLRTNYFSRLAQCGTPGDIALAILLNFPVWAAGAKNEAAGLRRHYGLGKAVPGTDKRDTDILDRFATATEGFRASALRIIARDLVGTGSRARLERAGRWAVEYEAMVWQTYYADGLLHGTRGGRTTG
ncbi:MAG: hypothetical protein ACE5EV_08535 [Gaiellales bacterium]